MNLFRYADDYYRGWLAEQLLLPAAILFSIAVVLFMGIHLIRRSSGHPVATEDRGLFPPGAVERYELGARLYHWGNFLFLAGLAVSGVALFVPGSLRRTVLSWLHMHEIFAALFIAGVVLHIVVAPRRGEGRTMWFERRDWSDLGLIWANFLGKTKRYPAFGKYDPVQKLYHGYIALATALVIFTGTFLVISAEVWASFPHEYMRWMRLLHDVAAFWLIAIILGHIYFGLIRVNWPELRAMISGSLPSDYLRLYHSPERWRPRQRPEHSTVVKHRIGD